MIARFSTSINGDCRRDFLFSARLQSTATVVCRDCSQIASSGESQKIFQAAAATVHYKVDRGGEQTAFYTSISISLFGHTISE